MGHEEGALTYFPFIQFPSDQKQEWGVILSPLSVNFITLCMLYSWPGMFYMEVCRLKCSLG